MDNPLYLKHNFHNYNWENEGKAFNPKHRSLFSQKPTKLSITELNTHKKAI